MLIDNIESNYLTKLDKKDFRKIIIEKSCNKDLIKQLSEKYNISNDVLYLVSLNYTCEKVKMENLLYDIEKILEDYHLERDNFFMVRNQSNLYTNIAHDLFNESLNSVDTALCYNFWKNSINEENDLDTFKKSYSDLKNHFNPFIVEDKFNTSFFRERNKENYEKSFNALKEDTIKEFTKMMVKIGLLEINNDESLFEYIEKPNQFVKEKEVINESADLVLEDKEVFNEDLAPKNNKTKRQKIEALITKVISTLDVTGLNTNKYKKFFGKMTDSQFDQYMRKFLKDEDENFYLEILPNKNEPSLEQLNKALDILKVPMNEYLYLKHDGHKDDPIRTAYKVPIGYITVRRVQQILSKKNTYSLDISQRNMKTG
ncbi:hypothetical protein Bp8pS_148 [Bacillus phage vB_BpuM-BpSp]|nr:hypothetical protein Bp8pS_148 [Bacillus phage vB_BpuM-BpSp]